MFELRGVYVGRVLGGPEVSSEQCQSRGAQAFFNKRNCSYIEAKNEKEDKRFDFQFFRVYASLSSEGD